MIPGLLLLILLFIPRSAMAFPDKEQFDVRAAPKSSGFNDQKQIGDGKIEATLLEGGFFTLGTGLGISASAIDDHNTLTYGHPFAKTSYPLIALGNHWSKPGEVAGAIFKGLTQTDKALSVAYALPGGLGYRFSIELDQKLPGVLYLRTELTNSSATAMQLPCAIVLDPGLGFAGQDAEAIADGTVIARETSANPIEIDFWERGVGHKGVGFSISFEAGSPDETHFSNWRKIAESDDAAFTPSASDALYDLTTKTVFKPVAVPAGGKAAIQVKVSLLQPDFGNSAFLRWDCPRFFSTSTGRIVPQDFPTTLQVFNPGAAAKRVSMAALLPYELLSDTTTSSDTLAPGGWTYTTRTLHVRENYTKDAFLTVSAQAVDGQAIADSLSFHVFQPMSPFSNEGLTVTIDSASMVPDGSAHVFFHARQSKTGQPIFDIGKENLILRQDGTPITDFSVGKDTTGGASQLDVVFILDVTGSMGEEINGVKDNILRFGESLSQQGVDYRLGMVTFLDAIENVYPLTSNIQTFKAKVSEQYAHGGGDAPENSLDALTSGASLQFRDKSKVIFIWITDAEYHQSDAVTPKTANQVLQTLLQRDIQVFCIGTPGFESQYYSPIYQPTGGRFYDINGNFQDILLNIADTRYSSGYMLTYKPAGGAAPGSLALDVHWSGMGGQATWGSGKAAPKASQSDAPLRLACTEAQCDLSAAFGSAAAGTLSLFDMRGARMKTVAWDGSRGQGPLRIDPSDFRSAGAKPGMLFFTFKDRATPGRSLKGQILFIDRK